jgi:cytochrome c556
MNFIAKSLVVGIFLFAGAAMAAEATDPDVIARQALMKTVGMNTKVLGDMAGGKAEFDATKAAEAKAALVAASAGIGAKFEPQATDPVSEAKPEIWMNWEDYLKKASALNVAASALDTASVTTVGAGMAGLAGACKDCHTLYRVQK